MKPRRPERGAERAATNAGVTFDLGRLQAEIREFSPHSFLSLQIDYTDVLYSGAGDGGTRPEAVQG